MVEQNFSNKNEIAIILDSIFEIGNKYETNENVLDKIDMLFIEDFFEKNYKIFF